MRSLALSGGGFRATLYHLGVLRCLAEEGKLTDVDAIYSVSGGSILAAHAVLNWSLYRDPQRFPEAAESIISFIRRDVRRKVFQRWFWYRFGGFLFPLAILAWAFALPVVRSWLAIIAVLFSASIIWMAIRGERDSFTGWLIHRYEWVWRSYGIWLLPVAVIVAALPLPWILWWSLLIAFSLLLLAIPIEFLSKGNSRVHLFIREYEPLWHRYGLYLLPFAVVAASWPLTWVCWGTIVVALALIVLGICLELGWHQHSRVRLLVKQYEDGLYGAKPGLPVLLSALAGTADDRRPKLFLLATNMNTGDLCAFSDDGFHCWTSEHNKKVYGSGDITVAEAVAASSAFPPAFTPFALRRERLGEGPGGDLPGITLLTDGGVYDNSGIEGFLRHWGECRTQGQWELIVSSAERAFDPLEAGLGSYRFLVYRAIRATDIVMKRVGEYQIEALKQRGITVGDVQLLDRLPSKWLRDDLGLLVRTIRTDLNRFSVAEAQLLVYHGYLGAKRGLFLPGVTDGPAAADEGVVVSLVPFFSRTDRIGLQPGMSIAKVEGNPVRTADEARRALQGVSLDGGTVEVRRSGTINSVTVPALSGFVMTDNGMPFVASATSEPWLPFPGDDAMKRIMPTNELHESHSVRMFSAVTVPVSLWLVLLLVLAGSAGAFVYLYPGPMSLSFSSVFDGTPVDRFERDILEEIERDELTRKYKQSITPEDPASSQVLVYGITKALGDYCQGRAPAEFQCRIKCAKEECKLEVRLFLRSEAKDKRVYQMLSGIGPQEFSVPASRASDRLLAIGRVNLPEKGGLGDLKELIRLEVSK
jgi:predicted acylesterase/phospholipase RssA